MPRGGRRRGPPCGPGDAVLSRLRSLSSQADIASSTVGQSPTASGDHPLTTASGAEGVESFGSFAMGLSNRRQTWACHPAGRRQTMYCLADGVALP